MSSIADGRDDLDELKSRYADRLSTVDPSVRVEYFVMTACDLLHRRADPGRYGVEIPAASAPEGRRKTSGVPGVDALRSRMTEIAGRKAWIGGKLAPSLTPDQVLAKITSGDSDLGGFALIRGGKETANDLQHPRMQGFCHQRSPPGKVGSFTRWQSVQLGLTRGNASKAAQELRAKEEMPQTYVATGFHDRGELVSLDYLAFLCRERKLADFTLQHLVLYEERDYLSPFINDLLQRRWDLLKSAGESGDAELTRALLKLLANCEYRPVTRCF